MFTRLSIATLFTALVVASTGCRAPIAHGLPVNHNLPPAQMMHQMGPGHAGPGPAVMPAPVMMGPGASQQPAPTVQVYFLKPEGMQVRWDVEGDKPFDSTPLIVPGRHNFPQGGIYRLKLTNVEGREGVELYPTLEIGPTTPRTAAYLAHNAIPTQFTDEDFDQVLSGNFVTKVIYLPDPEFQELALAGVETLVSTRLDAGVDPVVEADRRGAILAIVRLGNKDEEMPAANGEAGGVAPTAYFGAINNAQPPVMMHNSGTVAPNYVSGVTSPPWGMPMSGTPFGLPGPPHIPYGGPAGMQAHIMHNHTQMFIPKPTRDMRVNVQQSPGYSYPPPADRVFIQEQTIHPQHINRQPPSNMIIGSSGRRGRKHSVGCPCPQCQVR